MKIRPEVEIWYDFHSEIRAFIEDTETVHIWAVFAANSDNLESHLHILQPRVKPGGVDGDEF